MTTHQSARAYWASITASVTLFALAVGAAIPVEALCGIPGVGQLAWHSALARDLPLLTSVSFVVIAFTVLANSGADLLADERGLAL